MDQIVDAQARDRRLLGGSSSSSSPKEPTSSSAETKTDSRSSLGSYPASPRQENDLETIQNLIRKLPKGVCEHPKIKDILEVVTCAAEESVQHPLNTGDGDDLYEAAKSIVDGNFHLKIPAMKEVGALACRMLNLCGGCHPRVHKRPIHDYFM